MDEGGARSMVEEMVVNILDNHYVNLDFSCRV